MDDQSEPKRYEIHIRGSLGEGLLAAFPGLAARRQHRETLLVGEIPDQAALHGVIGRIESLGLELLEVRRLRRPSRRPRPGASEATGDSSRPTPEPREVHDERTGR